MLFLPDDFMVFRIVDGAVEQNGIADVLHLFDGNVDDLGGAGRWSGLQWG